VELAEDSPYILCPGEVERNGKWVRCNARIHINRRKPKDNPLACSECGQPLRITDADGETELNEHWRLMDESTPLALIIADKFKLAGFSTRQMADKWRKFERDLSKPDCPIKPERVIEAADECLIKRGESFGSACWSWIIARYANKTARDNVKLPTPQTSHRQLMVE